MAPMATPANPENGRYLSRLKVLRMQKLSLACLLMMLAVQVSQAQRIPSVDLQDGAGKKVRTHSLIDNKTPFVVTAWTTTCKHCLKELDALSEEIADWNGPSPLRIYAVSLDDSRSLHRAIAMASGRDWEGIVPLFDPKGDLKRALNIYSYPRVFVYDADGNLFYTHVGYLPGDEKELMSQIRECFAE